MKLTGLLLFVFSYISTRSQGRFDFSVPVQVEEGKTTTLDIFKGKPMILDFFGEGCVVCFKQMPKVDSLYNRFNDSITIVLVGDDTSKLPQIYNKFRRRYGLKLPVAFSPQMHMQIKPPYTPYYVWLDKQGRIVGNSDGNLLTDSLLSRFLGGDYSFLRVKAYKKKTVDGELNCRRNEDIFFASGFSKAIDSVTSSFPTSLKISEDKPYFKFVNCPLLILFKLAWFGQESWYRNDPLYGEIWPSVEFEERALQETLSRLVCYSMTTSEFKTQNALQDILKQDLSRSFGLNAYVYETDKPCWVIRRIDTGSIVVRSEYNPTKKYVRGRFDGFSGRSCSFSDFLGWVEYAAALKMPIIDRTGIKWSIDVDFSAIMTDWNDVEESLKKGGFSLVQESRKMRVLKVYRMN